MWPEPRRVILLLCVVSTACSDLREFGERNYSVGSLMDPKYDKLPPIANDQLAYRTGISPMTYRSGTDFAYALKIRSDVICAKYKVDIGLSQTGNNFLADSLNILLAPVGALTGGITPNVISAVQGASTGFKNAITNDIYGQVTGVVANYIDAQRNDYFADVKRNLGTPSYSRNYFVIESDLQVYHHLCSLLDAVHYAQAKSGQAKAQSQDNLKKTSAKSDAAQPATAAPKHAGSPAGRSGPPAAPPDTPVAHPRGRLPAPHHRPRATRERPA